MKYLLPALAAALTIIGVSGNAEARRTQSQAESQHPQTFIQKIADVRSEAERKIKMAHPPYPCLRH